MAEAAGLEPASSAVTVETTRRGWLLEAVLAQSETITGP